MRFSEKHFCTFIAASSRFNRHLFVYSQEQLNGSGSGCGEYNLTSLHIHPESKINPLDTLLLVVNET